jgi:hypothetical protein
MNCLEIKNLERLPAKSCVVFLNGEDVTDDTLEVKIIPPGIYLIRLERPSRTTPEGNLATTVTQIDELKVNA